jgi:hypothetical protein
VPTDTLHRMDFTGPAPIVDVHGYDRVIAEWPLDPTFLAAGAFVLVIVTLVIAAMLWRHL